MAETRALKRVLKNLEYVAAKADEFGRGTDIKERKSNLDILSDEWKDFLNIEKVLNGRFNESQMELVNKIEPIYIAVKQVLYIHEREHEMEEGKERNSMEDLLMNQSKFVQELSSINKRDNDVRLPRVNIPHFSGNYSEFPSFKDLFESSIDKNESMSSVHKLQYLKSLLKGEAYTLINHLNVTEANYTQAWEKIKARYNKPKHVVHTLIKRFMEQPVLQQSSAKGLRHLTDISDEVIRGLHVLGEHFVKRDPWLIYLLMNKLDEDSREAWAHHSANQEYPSLDSFFEFLTKRSDALECITSSQRQKTILPKRVGAMTTQVTMSRVQCPMCSEDHYLGKCEKYLKLNNIERKEFVAKGKFCFNCLSWTHQAMVCRSKYTCRICRRKHHVTLHLDSNTNSNSDGQGEPKPTDSIKAAEPSVHIALRSSGDSASILPYQAILPTAIVVVEDQYGKMWKCRALLDSGSQSSFVTENCAQRLQLVREKANVQIRGLTTGNLTSRGKSTIALRSMYDDDVKTLLDVLIIKSLPTQIPKARIYLNDRDFMKDLNLADPHFDTPSTIDILIGADKFFEILEKGQRRHNSLILSRTVFGWVASGQPCAVETIEVFTALTQDNSSLEQNLRKFWEIENVANDVDEFTPEERECETIFLNTHKIRFDGRYIVKLPFKKDAGRLGDSLQAATVRFRSLERKLTLNPELREKYVDQMREYIKLGHMMEVSAINTYDEVYYLPHHPVMKETNGTTKVRIVFDGSSKTTSGVSLTNKLMVGPTIQPTLWEIILRFRTKKIALVADIEKMYRQVVISEEQRRYQTVLWRERPDESLRCYQLTRVTFGLACSAFLAIRTMQQLAKGLQKDVRECIINDFYVDDLLTGSDDLEEAAILKHGVTDALAKGGFCLTKWKSNENSLCEKLNDIPVSDICCDKESTTKTLGLQWHRLKDAFTFKIQAEKDGAITKRKIISESSRLFDPLGFLSPSIVILKILFQKLWLRKIDWDDKLPPEIENQYSEIRNKFIHFEDLTIPRHINHEGEVQIHGFADASEIAYCAVIYSRTITRDGNIMTQLLTSKTKVAPIKKLSLPRLELCAAQLLAKLMSKVQHT